MKKPMNPQKRQWCGWVLSLLTAALLMSEPVRSLGALPDEIRLTEGYGATVTLSPLARVELDSQEMAVLSSADERLGDVTITGQSAGETTMTVNLLGVLPIKQVAVSVEEEKILIPGGQTVGVALQTDGVLVVGASDLGGSIPSPARQAGLKAGDLIMAVDGTAVIDAGQLSSLIDSSQPRTLTVQRGQQQIAVDVQPTLDPRDNQYRLGVWVRDSTAGVGTLSFYDPESGTFGALGHAITDQDTGVVLPARQGELLPSVIEDVRPGQRGQAGELVSRLQVYQPALGSIEENGVYGIYGQLYDALENPLYPQGVSIMQRDEVRLGPAQILSSVDENGVQAYDVEIVRVSDQNSPQQRSLVLRVTDPDLLEKTGGIVQGMSGSPIIQDDRLVGAVTHVYVDDPTMGYGLFIEWMLEAAG